MANLDHLSGGRVSLNVVSSWWSDEARQYGVQFDAHDDRYARTAEWLAVVDGMWTEARFSYRGQHYRVEDAILEPKPAHGPGRRSTPAASRRRRRNSSRASATPTSCTATRRSGSRRRSRTSRRAARERAGHAPAGSTFGVAGYVVCRDTEAEAERERVAHHDVRPDAPASRTSGSG